jgi:hypothetical protein
LFPDVREIIVPVPGVAVAVNVMGLPLNPLDVAVIVYVPTMLPNVRTLDACPLLFVVVVVVLSD